MYKEIERIMAQENGIKIEHVDMRAKYLNSFGHKVCVKFNKFSFFKAYDQSVLTGTNRIYAAAEPGKNKVVINDYTLGNIAGDVEMYTKLLQHEIGHIRDYKDRGFITFYVDACLSFIKKIEFLNVGGVEALIQYYDTSIEKKANSYYNLTYKDFIK